MGGIKVPEDGLTDGIRDPDALFAGPLASVTDDAKVERNMTQLSSLESNIGSRCGHNHSLLVSNPNRLESDILRNALLLENLAKSRTC